MEFAEKTICGANRINIMLEDMLLLIEDLPSTDSIG